MPQPDDDEARNGKEEQDKRWSVVPGDRQRKVVAEPGHQRDVPSPPELADRIGRIRPAEVLLMAETEDASKPDPYV